MPELLVMRHAKSAWDTGHDDFDRPLSSRGERDAARMSRWIIDNDVAPDRVISSSAERARRTAMAVVEACEVEPAQVEFRDELYHADTARWIDALREQQAPRILIVGHNPGLDDLVEYLSVDVAPRAASGKLMTTAAIAHLELDGRWAGIGVAGCRLLMLVRPREL